jgi:hypothetical protein
MTNGLLVRVYPLIVFMVLCADFVRRMRDHGEKKPWSRTYRVVAHRRSSVSTIHVAVLGRITMTILGSSVWWILERGTSLRTGFAGRHVTLGIMDR